jgi:hypothetical protein
VFPLLSAISLFVLGRCLIWRDWDASSDFAFDATNGKLLVFVPAVALLSGIPALIYTLLRRHPKYMGMPRESAPSTALSAQPASVHRTEVGSLSRDETYRTARL